MDSLSESARLNTASMTPGRLKLLTLTKSTLTTMPVLTQGGMLMSRWKLNVKVASVVVACRSVPKIPVSRLVMALTAALHSRRK